MDAHLSPQFFRHDKYVPEELGGHFLGTAKEGRQIGITILKKYFHFLLNEDTSFLRYRSFSQAFLGGQAPFQIRRKGRRLESQWLHFQHVFFFSLAPTTHFLYSYSKTTKAGISTYWPNRLPHTYLAQQGKVEPRLMEENNAPLLHHRSGHEGECDLADCTIPYVHKLNFPKFK